MTTVFALVWADEVHCVEQSCPCCKKRYDGQRLDEWLVLAGPRSCDQMHDEFQRVNEDVICPDCELSALGPECKAFLDASRALHAAELRKARAKEIPFAKWVRLSASVTAAVRSVVNGVLTVNSAALSRC